MVPTLRAVEELLLRLWDCLHLLEASRYSIDELLAEFAIQCKNLVDFYYSHNPKIVKLFHHL